MKKLLDLPEETVKKIKKEAEKEMTNFKVKAQQVLIKYAKSIK